MKGYVGSSARVALLNLAYFGVGFSVALAIGSVSLFADSIDFLEDTSINFLILIALGWSARHRSHMGMALAGILLIPGLATIWTAWDKFLLPGATITTPAYSDRVRSYGCNLTCALMLARYRTHGGGPTRAAFLSARNDVLANVAIVGAGLVTAYTFSAWPDLVVGLGIFFMNLDAARDVYVAARRERAEAAP